MSVPTTAFSDYYTFKVPNNNYSKELFNNIYRRVLFLGVKKKSKAVYIMDKLL